LWSNSETVSIPVNPRSHRPVGYAFVDLATAHEAQSAITELSGKEILLRPKKVPLVAVKVVAAVRAVSEAPAVDALVVAVAVDALVEVVAVVLRVL
jgi:hypothetical protein